MLRCEQWLENYFPAACIDAHTEVTPTLYLLETETINLLVIEQAIFDNSLINAASLDTHARATAIATILTGDIASTEPAINLSDELLPLPSLSPQTLGKACQSALFKRRASLVYPQPPNALQQFCSTLAHDIKAQSRHVRQLSEMLFSDLQKRVELDETEQESAALITAATHNIDCYIDGLRCFLLVPVALTQVGSIPIASLIKEAEKQYADYAIHLDIATECEQQLIEGDPTLLQLLVNNLVDNAVKFCNGEPNVTIRAELNRKHNCFRLLVSDEGIGIEPEFQKRIFKPFTRLNNLQHFPGAGLGLATVLRILNLHNGNIAVTSKKQAGSTFKVTLPLKVKPEQEVELEA